MSFHRLSMLAFAALSVTTAASAEDPAPRISALEALGRQNISSVLSDPRTGGPQGISLSELPAGHAYCQSKQVDAFWAVRAGSTAPIPLFDLAHPSHNPHVKGSRPFVSEGPISQAPGYNPRHTPRSLSEYRHLTSAPAPAPAPAATPVAATAARTPAATSSLDTPLFSSAFREWGDSF